MKGDKVENLSKAKNGESGPKRERSTIEFPYGDLGDAISVAQAIHGNAGVSCTTEQLAAFLKQSVSSGAFRLKVATARVFGITENERGKVSLSELGRRIVNPDFEKKASVEAFLKVPLYKEIYAKYSKHMLPPAVALEREMAQLGVASKQTSKARQAFERSAEMAGFFAHGSDRLVMPVGIDAPETPSIEPSGVPTQSPPAFGGGSGGGSGGGGIDSLHPFIQGLLMKLPNPDENWSTEERVKWLRTAANIFDLIYKGHGQEITVDKRPQEGGSALASLRRDTAEGN